MAAAPFAWEEQLFRAGRVGGGPAAPIASKWKRGFQCWMIGALLLIVGRVRMRSFAQIAREHLVQGGGWATR